MILVLRTILNQNWDQLYRYSYKEAFKDRVISDFDVFNIKTRLTLKKKKIIPPLVKELQLSLEKILQQRKTRYVAH